VSDRAAAAPTCKKCGAGMRDGKCLSCSTETNGEVTAPQMKILTALATFESLDRSSVDKKWIAALSEASHRSSSFSNNLGRLRSLGYIDYPGPGLVSLTKAGRAIAPHVDAPQDPTEMLAPIPRRWTRQRLPTSLALLSVPAHTATTWARYVPRG
jgi:hypothetical protein